MSSPYQYFNNRFSITQKLIISYLFVGIVSTLSISYFYYKSSQKALISRTLDQLSSIKYLKRGWIENYFNTQKRDIALFTSLNTIPESFEELNEVFHKYGLKSKQYAIADSTFGTALRQFRLNHEDINVWFVNQDMDVFYTTVDNKYKGINILKSSGLNPDFTAFCEKGMYETTLRDMPFISAENKTPVIIMAAPVKTKDPKTYGMILVEINIDQINQILSRRTGMGNTGESYVVGQNMAMRSQSRFIDRNDKNIQVLTKASDQGFRNIDGQDIIDDYRGVPVLSSYTRIDNKGIDWVLISEIDLEEAMQPIYMLRKRMIIIDLIICLFIIGITFFLSRVISQMVNRQNKLKTAALVEGQENERKRMSRELHDGIGQMLTVLKFKVQEIEEKSDTVKELKQLIDDTTQEVRRVSVNLMPSVLWDFGLESALKILIKNTKLKFDFSYKTDNGARELTMDERTCLYRIAQESISNVLKYAETEHVKLTVYHGPEYIQMIVEDHGKGFDISEYRKSRKDMGSNGIRNMKERVSLLNGTFEIISELIRGTKITVNIPFEQN